MRLKIYISSYKNNARNYRKNDDRINWINLIKDGKHKSKKRKPTKQENR